MLQITKTANVGVAKSILLSGLFWAAASFFIARFAVASFAIAIVAALCCCALKSYVNWMSFIHLIYFYQQKRKINENTTHNFTIVARHLDLEYFLDKNTFCNDESTLSRVDLSIWVVIQLNVYNFLIFFLVAN